VIVPLQCGHGDFLREESLLGAAAGGRAVGADSPCTMDYPGPDSGIVPAGKYLPRLSTA
jgi:hypothetical protein